MSLSCKLDFYVFNAIVLYDLDYVILDSGHARNVPKSFLIQTMLGHVSWEKCPLKCHNVSTRKHRIFPTRDLTKFDALIWIRVWCTRSYMQLWFNTVFNQPLERFCIFFNVLFSADIPHKLLLCRHHYDSLCLQSHPHFWWWYLEKCFQGRIRCRIFLSNSLES